MRELERRFDKMLLQRPSVLKLANNLHAVV